ncbi:MAG: ribokinase [Acidimicrobiia bacterium]
MPDYDVVVIGSINHDLTVVTERHPDPGKTVLGTEHHSGPGGKGANQAVAAARLESRVAMIGRVGDDEQGRALVEALESERVDVAGVVRDATAGTGLAVITVDRDGENTIVVIPGANRFVDAGQMRASAAIISEAPVVLAQLEIPVEAVSEAAAMVGGTFLLNPAPAQALSPDLLERVDVLMPNRGELVMLAGDEEPDDPSDVIGAARTVEGPGAVVVTLGAEGAVLVEGREAAHIPSPEVEVVDTTGAGDAFCGAVAHALAMGIALAEAVRWGVAAGAIATTRRGAQTALPTLRELKAFL